jgi:hypothetical protein
MYVIGGSDEIMVLTSNIVMPPEGILTKYLFNLGR